MEGFKCTQLQSVRIIRVKTQTNIVLVERLKNVDYHDNRAYIYNANDTVTVTSNLWKNV